LLMDRSSRVHGLDTLRAFAIILVLMFHYMTVVSGERTFGYITRIGWMGVDLFFVLSGYLIADSVLAAMAKGQPFSLTNFYARRLLRTLPNYYAVYALYFLFPAVLIGNATEPIWRFLTFTQNSNFRPGDTFTHSWSLCIEEQFYFVFPLVILLIDKAKKSVGLAWCTLIAGMVVGIISRAMAWFKYDQAAITSNDYFEHIYYPTLTRFDELLPGIAIAMIKNFHPTFFERLMRQSH
jgi:peptidoglycan/LPS O-acetylase OafA/YrhL